MPDFCTLYGMKPAANREEVRKFRAGDESAFASIVRKQYALVLMAALALCESKQDANELVVLAFVHSWRYRKEIKINESIPNYFIRITQAIFKKRLL